MHIDVGVAVARDQGIRWGHKRGKWTLRERMRKGSRGKEIKTNAASVEFHPPTPSLAWLSVRNPNFPCPHIPYLRPFVPGIWYSGLVRSSTY